jgi:DNA-directed RNA polymerase subunit RPC12/RpoP
MSVSCVGTCSNCGARRFWLSDSTSLQMDDGRLKCLPHPGERHSCEAEGLTLAQASERGRLYRENFYVCRNCGNDGETIERLAAREPDPFAVCTVRGAMKWGWGTAAIVVPFLVWMRWWGGVAAVGIPLLASPAICWWENRKIIKALAARGLPRADAPGRLPIAPPTAGFRPDFMVGQPLPTVAGEFRATGPCCDKPDWIEAYRVTDEDRVPCPACGHGVMAVSEHAIH